MSHVRLDGSGTGPNSQTTTHPSRHCSISGASQLAQEATVKNATGMVSAEIEQHGKTGALFFFLASSLSDLFSHFIT